MAVVTQLGKNKYVPQKPYIKPNTDDDNPNVGGPGESQGYPLYTKTQTPIQNQLSDYYKEQHQRGLDSTLKALESRFNLNKNMYENQIGEVGDQYQALRNQSEVERYKAKSAMREALANRGQLDSGYGRQETLNMQTKFGNAINNINLQEAKAIQDIRNLIAQLQTEYEASRSSAINQSNSALASLLSKL